MDNTSTRRTLNCRLPFTDGSALTPGRAMVGMAGRQGSSPTLDGCHISHDIGCDLQEELKKQESIMQEKLEAEVGSWYNAVRVALRVEEQAEELKAGGQDEVVDAGGQDEVVDSGDSDSE